MAQTVEINAGADGDNTVIAAVAGRRINILALVLTATVAGAVAIKDGAGTTLHTVHLAVGVPYVLPLVGCREAVWFGTSAGNAFIINTTATQDVLGFARYELG